LKLITYVISCLFLFNIEANAVDYHCESTYELNKDKFIIKLKINKSVADIKLFSKGIEIKSCQGPLKFKIKSTKQISRSHHIYWNVSCNDFLKTKIKLNKNGEIKIYEGKSLVDYAYFLENHQPLKCIAKTNKIEFINNLRTALYKKTQ